MRARSENFGTDISRLFPVNPSGTVYDQVADVYFEEVIRMPNVTSILCGRAWPMSVMSCSRKKVTPTISGRSRINGAG